MPRTFTRRFRITAILGLLAGAALAAPIHAQDLPRHPVRAHVKKVQSFSPDRVLFKLKPQAARGDAAPILDTAALGVESATSLGSGPWMVGRVADVPAAINRLLQNPAIESAQPDYLIRVHAASNDPLLSFCWGLDNTGQNVFGIPGTPNADIDAPEAWPRAARAAQIAVAVIDSGVSLNHPDLVNQLWRNPREIAGNNIDDDSNGYIDDLSGWDFVENDNTPADGDGHGTHVAGTIAAAINNNQGVAGVSPNARIVPLRFLNNDGEGWTSDAIRAIDYCIRNNIRLSNNSWGSSSSDPALKDAIRRARDAGHLFIAAAGNDGFDQDGELRDAYPAGYELDNIVSVASLDHRDSLSWFSNFGAASVDLAAPGHDILSTFFSPTLGNAYAYLSGTSMAAPHVTAVAAMIMGNSPTLDAPAVRNRILDSIRFIPALDGSLIAPGMLNARDALLICPADFSGDGTVDDTDFTLFSQAYENFDAQGIHAACDLNLDGFVDDTDFVLFSSAYDRFTCEGPNAPDGLRILSIDGQRTTLAWNDRSNDERVFRLEQSLDGSHFSPVAILPPDRTQATIAHPLTEITGTGPLWFRVAASNAHGPSSYSAPISAAIPTRPTAPSNLRTENLWPDTIDLRWTDNSNNETEFRIAQSRDGVNWNNVGINPANDGSFRVTGLLPSTRYYFKVRAANGAGYSEYSNTLTIDTPSGIPAAPSNLRTENLWPDAIDLRWTDNSNNETDFRIAMSRDGVNWNNIGINPANDGSFRVTALAPSSRYYFKVRAANAFGTSDYSNILTIDTPSGLPAAPSNLRTENVWSTAIDLRWTDNSNNETEFRIAQSRDGVNWTNVGVNPANDGSFRVSGLLPNTRYFFKVRAANAFGFSNYTPTIQVTTAR